MLLTSAHVSVAVSSTIVFICTTALFLCGYVVQQKTVNDIREAIKPPPRPVHTNLYVPPKPDATTLLPPSGEDGAQVVEIILEDSASTERSEESAQETVQENASDDTEGEERLIQGSDGGFLRVFTKSLKKQQTILKAAANSFRERDSTLDSRERLSRAARRKALREEMKRLSGEDLVKNPNPYRRRRSSW